jgi:proline racemase
MNQLSITPVRRQTMDELWHEAEQLGRVSVEADWGGIYKARIKFERRSGTIIWAEGKHSAALVALAMAINEAREMGAGAPA